MKNSRKILFFDIDGTLLTPPPFTVPESTRKALHMAQEQGHLTFVNSGRVMAMIPQNIKDLGFDGYVCGCGTSIYYHDELLFSSTIPHDICMETISVLRQYKVSAFFEQSCGLLLDDLSPVQSPLAMKLKQLIHTDNISSYDEKKKASFTFDKFLATLLPDSDKEGFLKFCEKYFVPFHHGNGNYEVTQKEYSKATGIQFMLEQLHIPHENSYAFGDSVNDLPMLKYAANSVAMGNSMKEILPYCTYQTSSISDDGIYRAMEHFGLLG